MNQNLYALLWHKLAPSLKFWEEKHNAKKSTGPDIRAWGSFNYWESELTFGNLNNPSQLINERLARAFHKKWA